MTAKRPVFRVMKNGYDRFAVDDAIEKYAATVDELEKRITLYQRQAAEDETKIKELEKKYAELENSLEAKQAAARQALQLHKGKPNARQ